MRLSTPLRRVLAVLAGAVLAVLIVSLSDALVGRMYPLPAGIDVRDPTAMRAAIAAMPVAALVMLVAGWAVAAGIGAFVGVLLTGERRVKTGMFVAGAILLATLMNLAALPHPTWVWPASIVLIPLAGWVGARGAAGWRADAAASPRVATR